MFALPFLNFIETRKQVDEVLVGAVRPRWHSLHHPVAELRVQIDLLSLVFLVKFEDQVVGLVC